MVSLLGIGSLLTSISLLLLLGPPIAGILYTVTSAGNMPVFAPKDILSKASYGWMWGFWNFWAFLRGPLGMTGGAQAAQPLITNGSIGKVADYPEYQANATAWDNLLQEVVNLAVNYNATDYYTIYADTFAVPKNQSWSLSIYIVSENGSVLISGMSAAWDANATQMSLQLGDPAAEILPHYGVIVTLNTATIAEWLVTGNQVDYAKIAFYAMSSLYRGNVVLWTIR